MIIDQSEMRERGDESTNTYLYADSRRVHHVDASLNVIRCDQPHVSHAAWTYKAQPTPNACQCRLIEFDLQIRQHDS